MTPLLIAFLLMAQNPKPPDSANSITGDGTSFITVSDPNPCGVWSGFQYNKEKERCEVTITFAVRVTCTPLAENPEYKRQSMTCWYEAKKEQPK